jgi:hypothetical protein
MLPATNAGSLRSFESIHHLQATYPMKMMPKICLFICCLCFFARAHGQEVFSHTTTAENIRSNYTILSGDFSAAQLTLDSWAMIVKPNPGQKASNPNPVGAWYNSGAGFWAIYNENGVPMPVGVVFNYWFEPPSANFFRLNPSADGRYIIDHSLANNNPAAKIYATHRFPSSFPSNISANDQLLYYNKAELITVYNPSLSKWELKNQDGSSLGLGAYFVHVSPNSSNSTINEAINTSVVNATVGSASVATSTGYSDPTLNTHIRAQNKQAILQYIGSLGLEQRIKIQNQSAQLMNTVYRRLNRGTRFDVDSDGHPSGATGGDDCDDFNPLIHPSARELCTKDSIHHVDGTTIVWMPSLVNEDCNPATVVPDQTAVQVTSESDRDGDGVYSCECYNYGLGPLPQLRITNDAIQKKWSSIVLIPLKKDVFGADFLTHGSDCDDTNPAIGKNSQKCVGENKVATCVSGKWELKDCRKCVTQPNGTGLVVEW